MDKKDKRIDAYITASADFARPILNHIRQLVHNACPEVEETMKWSFPHFDYKGPFCSMAAFKEHCAFGFWKAAIMNEAKRLKANQDNSMGHLGKIKSLADLPPDDIFIAHIKEAISLNDKGIKLPPRNKKIEVKELNIPENFRVALSKNKTANKIFESFSPSHKQEYIEWITEAKTEETKNKRIEKAIAQIEEGKGMNWKYQRIKGATGKTT